MPYQGRITEIGSAPRSSSQAFTAIENGNAGYVIDGAMVGTTPGNTKGGKIPYMSAAVFGYDVPPLVFDVPIKIIGDPPPSSTLPTTLPTAPQHYAGTPEGSEDLALDFFGQSIPGAQHPGIVYGPIDPGYSPPKKQAQAEFAIDPNLKTNIVPIDMQPKPPTKPTAHEIEIAKEMARKAQDAVDQEESRKRYWLYAGLGAVAFWLWWRSR